MSPGRTARCPALGLIDRCKPLPAMAAATALRRVSGVIGLRRKSVAPIRIASTASSIEAYAVTISTQASGVRSLRRCKVSRPSSPGIF